MGSWSAQPAVIRVGLSLSAGRFDEQDAGHSTGAYGVEALMRVQRHHLLLGGLLLFFAGSEAEYERLYAEASSDKG
jgi:hypothetical protein